MKTTNEYIMQLRGYLPTCMSKYGVQRLGVFGSVARGQQQPDSDIDIYILHICKNDLPILRDTIQKMVKDLDQ